MSLLFAASEGVGFPVLPAILLAPLVGAAAIVAVPRSRPELHRQIAVLTSFVVAALSLWMLLAFETGEAGYQFLSSTTWVESLDIKFFVGIDGISLFLVVLTAVLFPVALLSAKPDDEGQSDNNKGYYLWLTLLEAGCLGVFLALDLFLFFLAFELTLIPMYFLIGRWGHGRKVYAATKFFLYTMAGSAFMMVSIVALAVLSGAGEGGGVTFDLQRIAEDGQLAEGTARWLFLGFAVAFAVKVPAFPFHTWLPDAHTEAPTAGSVALAGVLLKLGTYGFIRFGLYLFPEATVWFAPVMITIGTIGIVYGGIVAAMQRNLKRLVAYSSVAHMGFCILGIFVLTTEGIQGSIVQMVNHGIITGALFILLGYLYNRRHTYEMSRLVGLQKVAPVFAGFFTFFMLASIGLPGLSGFVGEFLVLLGAFVAHRWWAVVAATGVILAALYLLWAYQRVFHGEPDEENRSFGEIRLLEVLPLVPLVGLVLFLGVYPKPMLERIEPSVDRLLRHVEAEVPDFVEPRNQAGSGLARAGGDAHGDDDHDEGDGAEEAPAVEAGEGS